MPLFTYFCEECDTDTEKCFASPPEEYSCEQCGGKCVRKFSVPRSRVRKEAKEFLERDILPDAERILKKTEGGSDKDFFDICGE